MTIKKKDIKDVQKQLEQLVESCKQTSIKKGKKSNVRNGIGLPLIGWMAGAKNCEESKIIAVCSGRACFGYSVFWGAIAEMADRISKKKQITDVQYRLLVDLISNRYRGRVPKNIYFPQWVLNTQSRHECEIFYEVQKLCKFDVPLNLILNSQLTDLILFKKLIDSALGAKK